MKHSTNMSKAAVDIQLLSESMIKVEEVKIEPDDNAEAPKLGEPSKFDHLLKQDDDAEGDELKPVLAVFLLPNKKQQEELQKGGQTCHVMKSAAKGKQATLNAEGGKTGGGPAPTVDLTAVDERLLSIIPTTSIDGLSGTAKSYTNFLFSNSPVGSSGWTLSGSQRKMKHTVAGRRLDKAANATEGLLDITKEKLELKRKYYNKKLELMERQTVAMGNIAKALNFLSATRSD